MNQNEPENQMNNWYSYKLNRDDNVMIREFITGAYFDASPECREDAIIKSLGDNHTELCLDFCAKMRELDDVRMRETMAEDGGNSFFSESAIECAENEVKRVAEQLSIVALDIASK